MFDLGYTELLLVAIVALIVVGPKDLPKLMRAVGNMVAKVRATARHFKAGMDEMVRQAELDEMREKWDAHNTAIMSGTPGPPGEGDVKASPDSALPGVPPHPIEETGAAPTPPPGPSKDEPL